MLSHRRTALPARQPRSRILSTKLGLELLEKRELLAVDAFASAAQPFPQIDVPLSYTPVIVAGALGGGTPDSPSLRVTNSYPGVGSLFMTKGGPTGYICTGTLIDAKHVLTAGHCLDTNNDGAPDFKPGNVSFRTTSNGAYTGQQSAEALFVHPDFDGFDGFTVNDDVAIIKLKAPMSQEFYTIQADAVPLQKEIAMIGYGQSGSGENGYTVSPSLSVKRLGSNVIDAFAGDDEGVPSRNEVYYADFDGPNGTGPSGGPTLGNRIETTLGGGDSGGPAFADGEIVAINTFTFSGGGFAQAPFFGSGMGGIMLHPYLNWINDVLAGSVGGGGGGGGSGGGKGGGKPRSAEVTLSTPFISLALADYGQQPQVRQARTTWANEPELLATVKRTSGLQPDAASASFQVTVVMTTDSEPVFSDVIEQHASEEKLDNIDMLLEHWPEF